MGSCVGGKTQKELTTKTYSHKYNDINIKKIALNDLNNNNAYFEQKEKELSEYSSMESSEPLRYRQSFEDLRSVECNTNNNNQSNNIEFEPLLRATFKKTVFCEDITYQFEMYCNGINEQIIPKWMLRLTVDNLKQFYCDYVNKFDRSQLQIDNKNTLKYLLSNTKKVIPSNKFNEIILNILSSSQLFVSSQYSSKILNFFNVPYDIRLIISYNPYSYIYSNFPDFKYYQCFNNIINEDNKYKLLSYYACEYNISYNDIKYNYILNNNHSNMLPSIDIINEDDDNIYGSIYCYSYWIRLLQAKPIDFLINVTSTSIFSIVISNLSYVIYEVLTSPSIGIDQQSSWIIIDYLPKYLLFNHDNKDINSHIIYKYDPYNDDKAIYNFNTNKYIHQLLQKHDIDIDKLRIFCDQMQLNHAKCFCSGSSNNNNNSNNDDCCCSNDDNSLSEYLVSNTFTESINAYDTGNDRDRDRDRDHATGTMTNPNNSLSIILRQMTDHVDDNADNDEDKLELFFNTFINEEGEVDVTMYQFLISLQKLNMNLTEKQIVLAFRYIVEEDEEYIDHVDFTDFCLSKSIDNDDIKLVQDNLNRFIKCM